MGSFSMRQLGKTGLWVSPLGIGGGKGISSKDLLYAFEHGINYFFYSSDLHHFLYQRSAQALRMLCKRGSSTRDQVVLATATYVRHPQHVYGALYDQLVELGVEYIDIFHWGCIVDDDDQAPLLNKSQQLKEMTRTKLSQIEQIQRVNEELVERGLVRFVGASFHSRKAALKWMDELDVLMLRYNITHLGVEREIAPFLNGDKGQNPGIVIFKAGYGGIEQSAASPQQSAFTIPSCYRFALSQPWVDVVLTGPGNREEIDQALLILEQGPMSEQECASMRRYGASLPDLALLDTP